MNRLASLIALIVAFSAHGQELDLAPLVPQPPPKAPWLKKNQKPEAKKTKKKKKATPPPADTVDVHGGAPMVAQPPPALALPPLVPLAPPPPMVTTLAVLVQSDTDAKPVAAGLEGVAKIAPLTRTLPSITPPAQQCADDPCLASIGAAQKVDQLLVANYAKGTLTVKLVDVAAKKTISQAEQAAVAPDVAKPWAERLGCKLLVPAGCPASFGKIEEKRASAPVAAVTAAPPAPAAQRSWKKPTALAALGLGAAAAATAIYFGVKSHSDLDQAETNFHKNGAYTAADVETLSSGNNAAQTANVLFIVSGALLATSALVAFAF